MNGVGRPDPDSGIGTGWLYSEDADMAEAFSARDRVDYMLRQLDGYVKADKGAALNIDIVGFSRGAAMARDFSNRVASMLARKHWGDKTGCVQIRFLGLWDSVAQFGLNGVKNHQWQLAVPANVAYTAHAVALNEHRYMFPSESVGRDITEPGRTRLTRGFIGSHSDIGGSYGSGDLSDVALIWMVEQANLAGVSMRKLRAGWTMVANPLLHDKNTKASDGDKIDTTGDRDVCERPNNSPRGIHCVKQKTADYGAGSLRYSGTAAFVERWSTLGIDADGASKIVGKVNMKEYALWLKKHYGIDVGY